MKNFRKNIFGRILLMIVILFLSCKQNSADPLGFSLPEFPEEISIKPVMFKIDKIMSMCHGLAVSDRYLFLVCSTNENALQVFDKFTGEFVTSMLNFGRNTNEVSSPFIYITVQDNKLYVLNLQGHHKLLSYKINNAIPKSPEDYSDFNKLIGCTDIIPLSGQRYMTNLQNQILIVDSSGRQLYRYNRYPEFKETTDTAEIKEFYFTHVGRNVLSVKEDEKRLVRRSSWGYTSLIEFFHLSDTLHKYKELRINRPEFEVYREYNFPTHRVKSIKFSDKGIYGITDMATDNKYIYILYNKNLIKEDMKNLKANQIWCFDWEGNPVRKYTTKDLSLKRITIDEKLNRMYFVNFNKDTEEEEFGYFELI